MKNLTILLLLTITNYSYSQLNYNIVNAFPAPTSSVGDITFDGTYLWVGSHFENGSIYQVSPVNGAVIKVINTNITAIGGLTFGNGNLWAAENNSVSGKIILEVDTISGQTITTINHDLGDYTHGMEFHNNNLYVNMFYLGGTDTTVVMDQGGTVLDKHPIAFNYAHGIAYDGCSFWITSNESGGTAAAINEIDETTFGVMNSEGIPGGSYPNGLAWDGNYLWIANADSDSLYQIDLSICPNPNLGNDELADEEKISIFPNPVSDQLNIDENQFSLREIKIINSAGILIKESNTNLNQIDVSDIPSGIYFIRLVGEQRSATKRFVKN